MHKFHFASFICLALCCGCAMAQLDASSKPDDVLSALQSSGKNIKSFTANVKLNDADTGTGAQIDRFGKVWFQIKPNGDPVMHIVFDHKQVGGKKMIADKVEYLLDDGWVTDRTDATKTESRIQLVPKGQKVDLFQLGKSPFPMPIGQVPVEIQKQFIVTKVPAGPDDPANTVHLTLKPKPGAVMAKRFSSVDIWTDMTTKMPVKIQTVDPKQAKIRTADLIQLQLNPMINPPDVALPTLPPDWRTSDTPLAG